MFANWPANGTLAFTCAFSGTSATLCGLVAVVVLHVGRGGVLAVLHELREAVGDLGSLLGNHVGVDPQRDRGGGVAEGGSPSSVVTVHIEQADAQVAEALQVEEGAQVVVRRRVRSVDGEPHQLADSYFPRWLADEHPVFIQPGDLSAKGGLLASVGLPQDRCLDEITARMPTPDEARTLGIARGVPLMVHSRTGYAKDGRPLRHMITRMAADRVHVRYELSL